MSTVARTTTSSSTSTSKLFSAFAIADSSVFRIGCAAFLLDRRTILRASLTSLPRIANESCHCPCFHISPYVRPGAFFFFIPPWLRNVRVGANSPSLCPTMFSTMYTGR
jgi:hypothetical protein